MGLLVGRSNLAAVIGELEPYDALVWDCETTGLSAYHNSRMFSIAVSTLEGKSFYFNFKPYAEVESEWILKFSEVKEIFDRKRLWIAHNAKFDMHFMHRHGLLPQGDFQDTQALARLFENDHHFLNERGGYSLADCANRYLDQKKDDRVKEWMDKNFAYTSVPGSLRKDYHFELVPLPIISEYAMIDAEVTAKLYNFLKANCYETPLWNLEGKLCKTLFEIECRGIKVNAHYIKTAYDFESRNLAHAKWEVATLLDDDHWKDSADYLSAKLEARGFKMSKTEKGNTRIDDLLLCQKEDLLARSLLKFRDSQKRLNTYWSNYQRLKDKDDLIHTSFDQSGTVTGRLSARDPNLQNIPAEDTSDFPVRQAFIARPDFKLVSIDYKAVEFRLALEYAGEFELIEKIKLGHDPHTAAAEMTGLTRKQAKIFNFATLYGAGNAKLAGMLGCSLEEARLAKFEYFNGLPKLRAFIENSKNRLKQRGYVTNLYGRRYRFSKWTYEGQFRDNSYKACNLIIQGSSADIMKQAIISCEDILKPYRSNVLLSIHDEIIFEIHQDEMMLISTLKCVMEQTYQHRAMPLECSVEIGLNLHNLEIYEV